MSTIITCGPTGDYSTLNSALTAIATAIGSTWIGKGEYELVLQNGVIFDECVNFITIFTQLHNGWSNSNNAWQPSKFSINDRLIIKGESDYYTDESIRPKIYRNFVSGDKIRYYPANTQLDTYSILADMMPYTKLLNIDIEADTRNVTDGNESIGIILHNRYRLLDYENIKIKMFINNPNHHWYILSDYSTFVGTNNPLSNYNNYKKVIISCYGSNINNKIILPMSVYGNTNINGCIVYGSINSGYNNGANATYPATIRNSVACVLGGGNTNSSWSYANVSNSITNLLDGGGNTIGPNTYYSKSLGEIGFINPENGDFHITRQALSFGKGVKVPSVYTNDFNGNEIIFPSISPYYLFDIPNASAPKPSFADGVYGSYASGVVLAYPCDGRRSLLLESKPLEYPGYNAPWNLHSSLVPSMYGWVIYNNYYNTGFIRYGFTKLNGKKTATFICHAKIPYGDGEQRPLIGCFSNFGVFTQPNINLTLNPVTQKVQGVVGTCLIEGSYSGLYDNNKWNTYIMRINLSASTDSERVQLFIGHRGLARKITTTYSGALPSTLQAFGNAMVMAYIPGYYANFAIYDRCLSNNEIYNLVYDPFIMYRNNIKRRMFVITELIKSIGFPWLTMFNQLFGQRGF